MKPRRIIKPKPDALDLDLAELKKALLALDPVFPDLDLDLDLDLDWVEVESTKGKI